ncbi:MAG: hypothetical protein IPK83_17025 [Planctomycetes bacterium]|nr:hypothetical protein [Planctomycetota bacterium]
MNELTRYAIVILLDDCKSVSDLHIRITQRIHDTVLHLAAAPAIARRVFDEYRGGVRIAPTGNRSIVGTMNDLAFHLEWSLDHHLQAGPVRDLAVVEKDLNVIPQRTLDGSNARDRLIAVCRAGIE